MSLTDYLENALVNWLRGTTFPAAPGTLYVALFTANTTEAGGGTEVTGGSYARQPVTLSAPGSSPAGAVTVSNSTQVAFSGMPAATVVAAALYDAATGGNQLASDNGMTDVAVGAGQRLVFDAGELDFSVD